MTTKITLKQLDNEILNLIKDGVGTDHRELSHRDAPGQHPIESIVGLSNELNRIPEPIEAITNSELEELLK